jgi:hypothetical protein
VTRKFALCQGRGEFFDWPVLDKRAVFTRFFHPANNHFPTPLISTKPAATIATPISNVSTSGEIDSR